MRTEADFTTFVNDFLPEPYDVDQRARAGALIRD
jgi:hypothetical protein